MARRSVLFSPGDQPSLMQKAPATGADVIVFDLEDAVAPEKKEEAREAVRSVCSELDPDCELCVRINPLDAGGDSDVEAVLARSPSVDSVMVPKVDSARTIEALADRLASHDVSLPVLALLESPAGILEAPAIASADATDAVALGAEDLAAVTGATRSSEGTEILYARQRVVLAASAAGVDAIDTLVTDYGDRAALVADTDISVQWGFDGKLAIHPDQVPVINDGFTPDEESVDWARRVLSAREEANAAGEGVFTVDGEMIDAPLIAQAERILERVPEEDQA